MINKRILSSVLGSLGVFAVASTITFNAKASTYKTTPMLSYRYSQKTANYQDKSNSAHNKVNSKSVMNPAINNDSVNPNQYVDVIEYMKVKPRVSRVSYKYNATNKQLLIKGQAEGLSKIAVKYGHNKVRIFKVDKHSAFNVKYHFKGYGTFTVYGVNRKGKIVSNKYKIGSNKYATEKPVVYKNTRNKNGEKIYLSNVAPSTIRVFNRGKLVKEFVADSSGNTIFISQKKLRKSNSITIDQKEFYKKTSVRVKVPKLSIGEANMINY